MINRALPAVAARYTRSIHIERDYANATAGLAGYHVTPLVVQTIERISAGLAPTSTARAFSLVGPYGSGKSAFGVFLAHYLARAAHERVALLADHGYGAVSQPGLQVGPALLPLLISGNNSSLRLAIVHAVQRLIAPLAHAEALALTIQNALAGDILDPQSVTDLVAEAANVVRQHTPYGGVALIIDELGQYLNYTARHSDERDLFVLQTLAEMAARSGDARCLVVTILHQTFDRYATNAGATQRLEWAKVQGRFMEISFQEPASQMMRMLGHALCPVEQLNALRLAWAAHLAPIAADLGLRPPDISAADWQQLVAQTFPLHPTVVVVLPLLFRQLAQNERSLFAFLHSPEAGSLADVLAATPTNVAPSAYRLPQLFEYVESTLSASLFGRARGQRWAELAEARELLPPAEPLLRDTLTAIGLLGALGQQRGVQANAEHLAFALRDDPTDPDVRVALDTLQRRQRIVYRKHRHSFLLWEGSDLDLEALVEQARRDLSGRTALVDLLNEHAPHLPFVARRFSYETGAIRYFVVRFVEARELETLQPTNLSADGEILFVVPDDTEGLSAAEAWATQPTRAAFPQQIVVLPQQIAFLRDLLLDVAALQQVNATTASLEHDRVARREMSSRLTEAQHTVDSAGKGAYNPPHSRWFWRGQPAAVQTARQLDALLSDVCIATYPDSPRIWNELIVRQQLSTAAAKARRVLIEAMLDHSHEDGLGIVGFPPERSIYENVFRHSGIHQQDAASGWRFGPPAAADPLRLHPVWQAINQFFSDSEPRALPLLNLYTVLSAPPFGVKAGLLPLLFLAAYLANAGEIALYEHGSFVPAPDIAVFERLLRQPGYITVRRTRTTGVRMAVYERLMRALAPNAPLSAQPAILEAVTPLLRFVARLPAYTRQTQHLSPPAQAVRYTLLNAPSPDELLFDHLPRACGLAPLTADQPTDPEYIERLFSALNRSFDELKAAYPALLAQITAAIRAAFKSDSSDKIALHAELLQRYATIAAVLSDNEVRTVGVRLQTANADGGWLESVAALVGKKSPETWNDDDARLFTLRIADIGHRFRVIEQIAITSQGIASDAQVLRVGIADVHGERSVVVNATQHTDDMQKLHTALDTILVEYAILSTTQRTAVLATILQRLINE